MVTVTATDPDGSSTTHSLTVMVEFVRVGAAPSWRLGWLRTLRNADRQPKVRRDPPNGDAAAKAPKKSENWWSRSYSR